jgi:serine/threonine protein phosphatase 1
MTEEGLRAYLVLLSLRLSCKYRGVGFLQFLLSGTTDFDEFCRRGRADVPRPLLDFLPDEPPKGFPNRRLSRKKRTREDEAEATEGGAGPRGRTIAIGDIHGCSTALRALLDAVAPRKQDTVVTLGNYIDRGPNSQEVVRLLLAQVRRCTLVPLKGDREKMFLAGWECRDEFLAWRESGGEQTLRSYGVEHPRAVPRLHCSFLNGCEDYFESETHIFVPAGYLADLPLQSQPGAVLRRQSLDTERPGPHVSGKVAVVGHTPQKSGEILDLGHLLCIDTNCHGGGWLTAVDVGSGHWWQANEKGEVREGALARVASDPATLSGQG